MENELILFETADKKIKLKEELDNSSYRKFCDNCLLTM